MKDVKNKYTYIEHTADVKFQAFGTSLEEAFENSALALIGIMIDKKVSGKVKKSIKVEGKDYEALLYNFLEELLFLLDSQDFLLSESKARISEKNGKKMLVAELVGDNVKKYEANTDVKAITYNGMFVKEEKGKWTCQVVVDV